MKIKETIIEQQNIWKTIDYPQADGMANCLQVGDILNVRIRCPIKNLKSFFKKIEEEIL